MAAGQRGFAAAGATVAVQFEVHFRKESVEIGLRTSVCMYWSHFRRHIVAVVLLVMARNHCFSWSTWSATGPLFLQGMALTKNHPPEEQDTKQPPTGQAAVEAEVRGWNRRRALAHTCIDFMSDRSLLASLVLRDTRFTALP